MKPKRTLEVLLACGAVGAAVLVGCGEDGGGDVDVGPAAVVPVKAPIYIAATVRPEGSAQTDANAALGKILDTKDPGAKIVSLIDEQGQNQAPNERFTYAADIEPWLGEQLGVFFTSFAGEGAGAAVIETTDPNAALEFARRSESGATTESQHNGTTYFLNQSDGDAFAIIGDFLVFGDEAGVKAAIDADRGDSLGDESDFPDAIGDLPEDRLGTLYTVPKHLLAAIPDEDLDPSTQTFFENAAGDNLDDPVAGSLSASAGGIELEFRSEAGGNVETPESSLVSAVPSDAWLALGIGDLGNNVKETLDQLRDSGIPDFQEGLEQVESATGTSIDELTSALGDAVIFLRGRTAPTLSGALIVQVENTDLWGRLLGRLRSLLSLSGRVRPLSLSGGGNGFQYVDPANVPAPIEVAQQDDNLVVGYGSGSVEEALKPARTLESSQTFLLAEDQMSSLGTDLFIDIAGWFRLTDSTGARQNPAYEQAQPYLDALTYLVAGSGSEGDYTEVRTVVGLTEE